MKRRIGKLSSDQTGGTAIEYGLIASLVVVAILAALIGLGRASATMWTNIADSVSNTA